MENLLYNDPIQQEIRRLRLRIALIRYDFREGLLHDCPLGIMAPMMQEIAVMQEQKLLLEMGRFKELPYHVRLLYP
jgi:hypothetical protein